MHIAVLAEPPVAAGSATAPLGADLPAPAGPAEVPGHEAGEPGYTRSQELFDIARSGERTGLTPGPPGRSAPVIARPPCPRWRAAAVGGPVRPPAGPRTHPSAAGACRATIRSRGPAGHRPGPASATGSDRRSPRSR